MLRKETRTRNAARATQPPFGILPKPPQRERDLWRFLTWPFILAQVIAAEQFFGTGAKAAQDDNGAPHPSEHTDSNVPYDDYPKDSGLSRSDDPSASQPTTLLLPIPGAQAQQSDGGSETVNPQAVNLGQSHAIAAGDGSGSSSDSGGGSSSSSSSSSSVSDLSDPSGPVGHEGGSFGWGVGQGIESTTLGPILGSEPLAQLLGIEPALDLTVIHPPSEPLQGTVQFLSQEVHSTLDQVTGIQLIPNTGDVLTQLRDVIDSSVSQITGLQLIEETTSLLTHSATQVLDAVDHATDLVSGTLGTLINDADHWVTDTAEQVSNILTHTLDPLAGSLEHTRDTVAALAHELSHNGNLATHIVDSGLGVLASTGNETKGLLLGGIAQADSLASHANDTVAATVTLLSTDTPDLLTDQVTQSGNVIPSTPALNSSTLDHDIGQSTSMVRETTQPALDTIGALTKETTGLLTNAATHEPITHTVDAVEATHVVSGLSHTTGEVEGFTALNSTVDSVSAEQSSVTEAPQYSDFGGHGDSASSQNGSLTTPTSTAELQQIGGTEAIASTVGSFDVTHGSMTSTPVTPQDATNLTALHQAGDVSSGVIPISAPALATASQADELFTGGQHTDYSLALQSNTAALSQTGTDTSDPIDTVANNTDVTSGDTSTHQTSSTDTHSSSSSTNQQNLDTSFSTSHTIDELGSRDHALI